ncbi:hypothetical protein [Paenibacillus zanthoxyli]|uniref:hypothetical protein n=1 Tax=Paenibacillus zanthoxyli TaxID=369399 RepID=UPI00047194EC|nr:hypothetical protein [Paenibacillus zanthoxyli]
MSNKTLIVLFFLALIIGGTAAGIFITETNQPMNHSSHAMTNTAAPGSEGGKYDHEGYRSS